MGSRSRDGGGGGSAGGPVAELSLPRFAILTAVRLGNPSCDHTPCGTIAHAHHLKMPLAEA